MSTSPATPRGPLGLGAGEKATVEVLIIDDEQMLLESCAGVLMHEGYPVTTCSRADQARDLLQKRGFDIVLLDLYMQQVSGMELLRACLEAKPDTIVIVMTANPSVMSSIEALQAGAWDYLPKPFAASHLQILIGRACHAVLVARETGVRQSAGERNRQRRPERRMQNDGPLLLGRSPALRRVVELAKTVARTDASVFITGESGTGKEVVAQFIHANSRRNSRDLVAVNCAALPETLLESEMFGHCKGAFTGAVRDKPGLLEIANGGTLFLDELTEMSLPIQAKLLRVLQDGVVRRVGSETPNAVVNVRFIAATNRDPKEAVEAGSLRMDLFYRLGVVPIWVPPLRERPEDIPLLAEHFLRVYWQKHREPDAPLPRFTRSAIRSLQAQGWNGNVRELQNAMEHAVVLLEPASEIAPEDLPYLAPPRSLPRSFIGPEVGSTHEFSPEHNYHAAREQVTAEFELSYLRWLVEAAGANMSKAAKIAGVDRTTLYRLMEKHGLHRDTIIKIDIER